MMQESSPVTEQAPAFTEAMHVATEVLASEFHDNWRKEYLKDDGTYEPRVRPTIDIAWSAEHDGATTVDIAGTDFEDLPDDWQAQNEDAAEVVVELLEEANGDINLDDPEVVAEVGSEIHDAWLSRHPEVVGGELDVPFAQLPPAEQAKDIDQVRVAEHIFAEAA
jgi:hypothetical protein